jgi:2-polyprenyl-3-methyl-5-hydroxy-6-metoxy-1,4-benzoquinol methylase
MKREFAGQYCSLEQWHWWFRGRQQILEAVLHRELVGRRAMTIASLGCGPAEGFLWVKSAAGPDGLVVGVDVELLHAPRVASGIEYVIGRLEALPMADGSFDAVLILDVLEHLDNDMVGLLAAARLVKPDGLLVVTVPALPSLWGRQDVVSHHRRRYTRRTLGELFKQVGLPAPRLTYFNTLLFAPISVVRWTRRALRVADRAWSDFDDSRPGLINEILTAVFAAEQCVIPRIPLPIGVSLLAILSFGSKGNRYSTSIDRNRADS